MPFEWRDVGLMLNLARRIKSARSGPLDREETVEEGNGESEIALSSSAEV